MSERVKKHKPVGLDRRTMKRVLASILEPLVSQEPVARLIRQTARQQWKLLVLNLGGSLVEALSEGATLGVLYLAVKLLSGAPEAVSGVQGRISALPFVGQLAAQDSFLLLLAVAVMLQALQSLCHYVSQVANGYFAARCKVKVTGLIHSQVLQLSYPCASHYKVGDLMDYSAQGPEAIRTQIDLIGQLLFNGLLLLVYLLVLVAVSPWLLLVAVLMAALIAALQKQLLPLLERQALDVSQVQVGISVRVTEDIQALRLLHTSGMREIADRGLQAQLGNLERAMRRKSRLQEVVGPLVNFLPVLAIALISALGVLLFEARGSSVLPNLVTFVIALQRLNLRIAGISGAFNGFAGNSAAIRRLNHIQSPTGKQFSREGGRPFDQLRMEVRFDAVDLQYALDLPPALTDISFTLPKGSMVALVGPSGAGKSSIADLLVGLYPPSSGAILVDGSPLDQLDLTSWQQRLGVVSQDTFLFNATIAENIAFGSPGVSRAQIEDACRAAQAAVFIMDLPDGLDTLVGERGYRLSGGQRQRLSLARAILRDPELLILDEATSALDSQSERLVQEAIERFERNHTVLVIAHRLSTIMKADQILVLNQGSIVEQGDHAKLLSQKGLYASLWRQQSTPSTDNLKDSAGKA